MTAAYGIVCALLALTALCCWLGVAGMLRMREPLQALHFLSLPASVGVAALAAAVWVEKGAGEDALKTALIAVVLLAFNSVTTHATARAFRMRQLGRGESEDTE